MKMLKVLHLTSTKYGIGGVEKLLLDMSGKYDSKRFEVSYCNLFCDANGKGVFPTMLRERNLKVFDIKGKRWKELPRIVFDLVRLIRKERFDIVHLHMLQATSIGGLAARIAGHSKVVITKHHTFESSKQPPFVKKLETLFTKNADCIAAISEYVRDDMIALSVPAEKISIICNGTDVNAFDERAREEPKSRFPDSPVLGTVGSLTERKGHEYLFKAMPIIAKQFPNVCLLVVGEGPEKESLKKLADEFGLESTIIMVGFQENVAPLLKQLDLYVHPSIHEPFGIAILEAMTAGKCVVATAVEGIPEIVIEGESGFLVPPEDPAKLAEVICRALNNIDKIREMGANGRKRVEKVFNIESTVGKYQDLYEIVTRNGEKAAG